jgi:hypothetical protein
MAENVKKFKSSTRGNCMVNIITVVMSAVSSFNSTWLKISELSSTPEDLLESPNMC